MKNKINKTPIELLRSLETHLFFLYTALENYRTERDRYKQVASELRVLVGDHNPKRRLLIHLMKKYDYEYLVHPSNEPLDYLPIQLKSKYKSKKQMEIDKKYENACSEVEFDEMIEELRKLRFSYPLDEYLEKALAVFIAPDEYSYRELIVAVAQQIGSSHEDLAVDEGIYKLSQIEIGGQIAYTAPIIGIARTCFAAGMEFITHTVNEHGYKCIYKYKETER